MNDTLMILGTHFIDENVISEYKKMRDTPNVDCLLAVDNEGYKAAFKNRIENRIFFDVSVRCFFFDLKVHDELELPHFVNNGSPSHFGNIMWLNGDYRFYYVKKFFPNYKYYWLIEYDVFCNAPDYSNFLDKFSNNSSDCLITHLRHEPKETSDWCWVQGIDWVYKDCETYGSFLPVVRLSARAVDFLYKRRLEHKEIYVESNKDKWIFCELFVPTELMNGGFSCENIDEPNITGTWYLNDSRFFLKQDGKLYHPIKYVKNKISAMQNQIDDLNLKLRKLFLITLVEKLQKTPAVGKNPLPLQMNEQFTQASLIVNLEQIAGGGGEISAVYYQIQILENAIVFSLNCSGNFSDFELENFSDLKNWRGLNIRKSEKMTTIFFTVPTKLDDMSAAENFTTLFVQNTLPILRERLNISQE